MSLSLFISREIDEESPFLDLELDVYADSQIMISFNEVEIEIEDYQWIFFSSKNVVRWAKENSLSLNDCKIAAIGGPTAKLAQEYFGEIDFVGDDRKETSEISSDFNEKVGENEKVLFPLSSRSKKNIIQNFHKDHEVVRAYEVIFDPLLFDIQFDYLIFTSPSNFQSFFSANSIQPNAQVIAIGETTKSEIKKYLNIPIFTPKEKTEKAIYELLKELVLGADPSN